MIECTIDTHVLADIIAQFSSGDSNRLLVSSEFLTPNILKKLNLCIESDGFEGVIIASSFAFIEIINRFETVSKLNFKLPTVIGILIQPPNWFIIEPFNMQTVSLLISIPKRNLNGESVELADAIHVATAMQRGPFTFLATHDQILSKLNYKSLELRHLI